MENNQNTQTRQSICKIMEKETAIKVLNEIKNKIGGVDLMDICDNEAENLQIDLKDENAKLLIAAIQCGLVYWDENKNCLIQRLINPVKCGELTANEFEYRNKITVNDLKLTNLDNPIDLLIKTMAQIVARPAHLIGKIYGQDIGIAVGCVSFFGK